MSQQLFQEGALWQKTAKALSFGNDAIWKQTKQILAIFCGKRTKKSTRNIWKLIKGLNLKYIFTDQLRSYQSILPKNKHIIGKQYTQAIESVNATFFHYSY